MEDILESLGLGNEVRELKLGKSFTDEQSVIHTLRYDFKPASIDDTKMVTLDVGSNNTMTVTVPNLDGTSQTIFKGSEKLCQKECVLIIDHETGEIVLERISSNIQVKNTRSENCSSSNTTSISSNEMKSSSSESSKGGSPENKNWLSESTHSEKSPSPEDVTSSAHNRLNSRTKVVSGKKKNPTFELPGKKCSPYHTNKKSISPKLNRNNSSPLTQGPGSLPVIGMEDDFSSISMAVVASSVPKKPLSISPKYSLISSSIQQLETFKITDETSHCSLSESSSNSSSNSSDSSDYSGNESDNEANLVLPKPINELPLMPHNILNNDLQLSESESESD